MTLPPFGRLTDTTVFDAIKLQDFYWIFDLLAATSATVRRIEHVRSRWHKSFTVLNLS